MDSMKGGYLGPEYDDKEIAKLTNKFGAVGNRFEFGKLVDKVAIYLNEGSAIGWFQGRMEFGPSLRKPKYYWRPKKSKCRKS